MVIGKGATVSEAGKVQVKVDNRYLQFKGEKVGEREFKDEMSNGKQELYRCEKDGEVRYRVYEVTNYIVGLKSTAVLDGQEVPLTEDEAREKYPALFDAAGMPVVVDLDE